jgi:2-methylcitrate dehydratase PrpD
VSVTATLAGFALGPVPAPESAPIDAARRTLLNAVAVAAGGAGSAPSTLALGLARKSAPVRTATVIGHPDVCEARAAVAVNGVSAHVEDFDDTHMATIVHPGASVVMAALAAAELQGAHGVDLLEAIVVGVEVALRLGLAVHPAAFDSGWHMSSVVGAAGSAAAAGRLLALDPPAMANGLVAGLAQAAGTQEALGTMTKPLHLGRAAANGLEAALLARAGLDGPAEGIEGAGGLVRMFAGEASRLDAVVDGLWEVWEVEKNSFKPYACGVVSHAAIDAGVRARQQGCDWRGIRRVRARTNPVVLDVMGVKAPSDELQAKFSVYHCVAVALRYGGAAPAQFRDPVVVDPELVALRGRIEVVLDPACAVEETELEVEMSDGTSFTSHVRDALGTPNAPLSTSDLREKARLTAGERLGLEQVDALVDALLTVDRADSISACLALTIPPGQTEHP